MSDLCFVSALVGHLGNFLLSAEVVDMNDVFGVFKGYDVVVVPAFLVGEEGSGEAVNVAAVGVVLFEGAVEGVFVPFFSADRDMGRIAAVLIVVDDKIFAYL